MTILGTEFSFVPTGCRLQQRPYLRTIFTPLHDELLARLVLSLSVNFPVKNLELKDYILLPTPKEEKSRYDLIANVVHDGEGSYRVSVHRKSEQQW